MRRLARPIAVAVGVGAVAGFVIGGGGARLAMRLVALGDREDFGRVTSAGAVVGDVTAGGTLAVLITGLVIGVFGALLYLVLRGRLPNALSQRTVAYASLVTGAGLFFSVNGNQEDFTFLDVGRSLTLFGLTFLAYGVAVPPLVDRLAPRRAGRSRNAAFVTFLVVALAVVASFFAVKYAVELSNGTRVPAH